MLKNSHKVAIHNLESTVSKKVNEYKKILKFSCAYVGESNEIAHILDSQIAPNTSPSIKNLCPRKIKFLSFLKRYITLL